MKIKVVQDLIRAGGFERTKIWKNAWGDIEAAIAATDWPHGSGQFTVFPESGKSRGQGNGVKPIKLPFVAELKRLGWETEELPDVEPGVLGVGDLDAMLVTQRGPIATEWETGNVSSSHRAINKLCVTFQRGRLIGGVLVVPTRRLAKYLTDRIGNFEELSAYFALWASFPVEVGVLRVVGVEHDAESHDVPRIPKGTDGRSLA